MLNESNERLGDSQFRAGHAEGRVVELEDHSRWEIQPGYEVFTAFWEPSCTITVVPGHLEDYPFDLINRISGERVPARFSSDCASWRFES